MLVDAAKVRPRCPAKAVEAGGGQHRFGATGVGQADVALDEAVEDESVDQAGHAALAEDHAVRQVAHADPPIRRVRDGQQRVVLGQAQVVLGAQLLVEAACDPGVRLQERTPRFQAGVAGGWRPRHPLGDGHGPDATPPARPLLC